MNKFSQQIKTLENKRTMKKMIRKIKKNILSLDEIIDVKEISTKKEFMEMISIYEHISELL
jgi:hypothetical protein